MVVFRLLAPSLAALGVALLVLDSRPGLAWGALVFAVALATASGGRR